MGQPTSWDAYNEFLLHGSLDRFTKILARYELFKKVLDIPGDIVEGGVFKGTGVLYWAKLVQVFNPLSNRRVVGFDTFEGYPDRTKYEYDKQSGKAFIENSSYADISVDEIMEVAASLALEHRIELVEGDSTKTIPEYVKKNPGFRVALLNLDFDIFEPTATALQYLYPLIVPGGVIAFDEYAVRGWGESDAVDQYFRGKHIRYQSIPWALSPAAYVIK